MLFGQGIVLHGVRGEWGPAVGWPIVCLLPNLRGHPSGLQAESNGEYLQGLRRGLGLRIRQLPPLLQYV